MTMSVDVRVDDVAATAEIVDGRVAMSAEVTDALRIETPDRQPLSAIETHATLRIATDDVRVSIDLDGDAVEALADALEVEA